MFGWLTPLLGILDKILGLFPSADFRAGKKAQQAEASEAAHETRDKMAAVKPKPTREVDDALDGGSF